MVATLFGCKRLETRAKGIRGRDMIDEFLEYVFGGDQEGFFALSLFKGGQPVQERYIRWPDQRELLSDSSVRALGAEADVYYTPSLYSEQYRTTDSALGSWVAWVDLDQPPASTGTDGPRAATWPAAGLVVASGSPGRSHRYWRSRSFLDPSRGRAANADLAINYGADKSGIDVAQLLRLPGSYNHKTDPPNPVEIIEGSFAVIEFPDLPDNVILLPTASIQKVPFTVDALLGLDAYTQRLFTTDPSLGERSDKLFELACRTLEQGWEIGQCKMLVDQAAKKWKKFDGRSDREEQIDSLLHRARARTLSPIRITDGGVDWAKFVSVDDLFAEAPELDWVVPGLLAKQGLMWVVGSTGMGKTSLVMNLAMSLAAEREKWLSFELPASEQKIAFASHEMPPSELKDFLGKMFQEVSDDEREAIQKRIQFRADGAHYLEKPEEQAFYEAELRDGGFTGLIVDTIGASVATSLQDEPTVRKIADWLDRIRTELGIWVIVIAHPRKLPQAAKNYTRTTDDLYGNRIFGDRANTIILLEQTRGGKVIRGLKTRFLKDVDGIYVKMNDNRWFETTGRTETTAQPVIEVVGADELTLDDLRGEGDVD